MAEVKKKKTARKKTPKSPPKKAKPVEPTVAKVAVPEEGGKPQVKYRKVISKRDRKGSIGPFKFDLKMGRPESVPEQVAEALIADGTCVKA